MPRIPRESSDDNMYSDAEMPGASSADTDETSVSSEEYELPKAVLMGKEFNVGDSVILKVTAIGEDTIRVKYETEKPESEGTESEEAAAEAPDEMASMME